MVNTCGFIQAAKQESIDELLSAAESGAKVAAVGCLAERYGNELADALPEAQILSFDDYGDIAARLDDVLSGRRKAPHTPRDRRTLLPLSPADRAAPGAGTGPSAARTAPSAARTATDLAAATASSAPRPPLRRPGSRPPGPGRATCRPGSRRRPGPARCAAACRTGSWRRSRSLPAVTGAARSARSPPSAGPTCRAARTSSSPKPEWLAGEGVRELFLVSENSTSYGKDLGNLRLLEEVLPSLAATPGIERVRISYLQPAELRPGLIEAIAGTPGVAPYFDLSFQHASGPLLRAMRRFGDRKRFLELIDRIRTVSPEAGIRSNFIVGFPGETAEDLHELELFLSSARLDAIGVFGYSDEDGTEAASLPGKLDEAEVARRVEEVADLAEELMAQRGADRIGADRRGAHRRAPRRRPVRGPCGPPGPRSRRRDHRPGQRGSRPRPARPGHRRVVATASTSWPRPRSPPARAGPRSSRRHAPPPARAGPRSSQRHARWRIGIDLPRGGFTATRAARGGSAALRACPGAGACRSGSARPPNRAPRPHQGLLPHPPSSTWPTC